MNVYVFTRLRVHAFQSCFPLIGFRAEAGSNGKTDRFDQVEAWQVAPELAMDCERETRKRVNP